LKTPGDQVRKCTTSLTIGSPRNCNGSPRKCKVYLADAVAKLLGQPALRKEAIKVHNATPKLLRIVVQMRHEALHGANDHGNEKKVNKSQAYDEGAL
jgi:hypothetical protein